MFENKNDDLKQKTATSRVTALLLIKSNKLQFQSYLELSPLLIATKPD
jgi:hypothetical protein